MTFLTEKEKDNWKQFSKDLNDKEFRLYVFVRTSLASMTPGRIAAQTNHAGSRFNTYMIQKKPKGIYREFLSWEQSTEQNFGTTIVLNGGNLIDLESEVEQHFIKWEFRKPHYFELILDPTYCFTDGKEMVLMPIITCGILFCSVADYKEFNVVVDEDGVTSVAKERYKLL